MINGKCLCGSVSFDLEVDELLLYQCHCSLCRKQGGSSSNSSSIIDSSKLHWRSGQETISSWVKDTGFRSDFCSCCGSPVPNPLRGTNYYWVPAGLIDKGKLMVVAHLYTDSKADWETISNIGERYKTMPQLSDFISLININGHA